MEFGRKRLTDTFVLKARLSRHVLRCVARPSGLF